MVMRSYARRAALWPLVVAFALAAMVAGHAIELAVENAGLLGDGVAVYKHVAQGPAEMVMLGLVLFAIVALSISIVRNIDSRQTTAASIVPALHALRRLGTGRIAVRVAVIQFPALIAAELAEQRLSNFAHPGLAAIFGWSHWTAPVIHCVMALIAAAALASFARMSCEHAEELVHAARALVRFLIVAPQEAPRLDAAVASREPVERRQDHPLAFRIANRPPPAIAAALA